MAGSTYNPVMTNALFSYLNSQVGQGLPQYPGQLTAGPNINLQNLSSYLAGGPTSIPGMDQLSQIAQTGGGLNLANAPAYQNLLQMAQTGNPINVTPEWQAMVNAMQQNTQQQAANLQESMSAGGNLVGTPYGTTMQDFYSNIGAQQQSLLGQLSTQAQQQAVQNQLAAQGQLVPLGLQAQQAGVGNQLGAIGQIAGQVLPTSQQLQGVQQAGLSNAYQAWLQGLPQYNPTLGYQMAAGTTFPQYMQKAPSGLASTIGSVLGGIAGGFMGSPGAISGLGSSLGGLFSGGGGGATPSGIDTSGLGGFGNLFGGYPMTAPA
jgi:hypothetical protein